MKWILAGFVAVAFVATMICLGGCDSPSSPELPAPPPFHLAATYAFPAPAKCVEARGGVAAVAAGSYGTAVLDVRDLAHLDTVFKDTLAARYPMSGASQVTLDTINHLVLWVTDPRNSSASVPVYNYETGQRVYLAIVQGPFYRCRLVSVRTNEFTLWGSDHTGIQVRSRCRDTDTSQWAETCPPLFSDYSSGYNGSASSRPQGFTPQRGDGVTAVAIEAAGVHLLDSLGALLSVADVRGTAYDCAWYQDSLLVVAANNQLVVISAADVTAPRVVSELLISTASELRRVAILDHWACVVDMLDGVYVVDMSNPRSPENVQLLKLGAATSICADNGRLYVTDEAAGLLIYTR